MVLGGKTDDELELEKMSELLAQESGAFELAEVFGVQQVIEPEGTREFLIQALERHCSKTREIGKRLMCGWPTTY